MGSGLWGEVSGRGFGAKIGVNGSEGEAIGVIGLGGEVVGSGFAINVSGGFAESCFYTFDCKLYFNLLKLLVLAIVKANIAFPGSTWSIWSW